MCATCDRINSQIDQEGAPLDAGKTKAALDSIAAAIKKGRNYSHFERVSNRLLGTEMGPRDRELEKRWQDSQEDPT